VVEVDPGDVYSDVMLVDNVSKEPVTVAIYGHEALLTLDGKYTAPPGKPSGDSFGLWIVPSKDEVTVQPYASVEVPFTVKVPEAATPGDYDGAVFTSYIKPPEETGEQFSVDMRVGVRLHLRVRGDLEPALRVDDLRVERANPWWNPLPGDVNLSFRVSNTGNVRVTAKGVAEANANYLIKKVYKTGLGEVMTPETLPGSIVVFSAGPPEAAGAWAQGPKVEGVWGFGKQTYTVYLVNGQVPNSDQKAPTATATITVWVIPWIPLVLLVLILLWLLRLIFRRIFRRRIERRRQEKIDKREAKKEQRQANKQTKRHAGQPQKKAEPAKDSESQDSASEDSESEDSAEAAADQSDDGDPAVDSKPKHSAAAQDGAPEASATADSDLEADHQAQAAAPDGDQPVADTPSSDQAEAGEPAAGQAAGDQPNPDAAASPDGAATGLPTTDIWKKVGVKRPWTDQPEPPKAAS